MRLRSNKNSLTTDTLFAQADTKLSTRKDFPPISDLNVSDNEIFIVALDKTSIAPFKRKRKAKQKFRSFNNNLFKIDSNGTRQDISSLLNTSSEIVNADNLNIMSKIANVIFKNSNPQPGTVTLPADNLIYTMPFQLDENYIPESLVISSDSSILVYQLGIQDFDLVKVEL